MTKFFMGWNKHLHIVLKILGTTMAGSAKVECSSLYFGLDLDLIAVEGITYKRYDINLTGDNNIVDYTSLGEAA